MNKQIPTTRFAALGLVAISAMAQSDPALIKFSGFGTLGAVHSSEKNADFVSTALQPDGAGHTLATAFSPDKKIGLQAYAIFGEMFSATVQGVSEYRYDRTYNPAVKLAFLKAQVTSEISIRAGRVPFPAYVISDYQKTGYAYVWVRPPVELYQFNPFTSIDGGDITWQTNVGSIALKTTAFTGSFDDRGFARGYVTEFSARKIAGLSLVGVKGDSTYRAFYTQFDVTTSNPLITAGLNQIRGGDPALANRLDVTGKKATYLSMAYQYDPGNWFFIVEAGRNAGDEDLVLHSTSGYATVGYRFGDWTPFLMVANRKTDSSLTATSTNPIPAIAAALSAGASALLASGNKAQGSYTAGLRWDFMKNFDLKLQYDAVKNASNSQGTLAAPQPAFVKGQSYNLMTINLDFVF